MNAQGASAGVTRRTAVAASAAIAAVTAVAASRSADCYTRRQNADADFFENFHNFLLQIIFLSF